MSMSSTGDRRPTPEFALAIALALNAGFLVIEGVAGWWWNSLALLADAGHMVTDVAALSVAWIAAQLRRRPPSGQYTFGLRRAPVLGGLMSSMGLVVVVVVIAFEAVERLREPPPLEGIGVLVTGVAGLGVNLGSAWYLNRSQDRSVNTRGAMLHLLSDAVGSVAAIVSAIAVMLWNATIADPIASLVIAVMVLVGCVPLVRDTVHILLQGAPGDIDLRRVRIAIEQHEGVHQVDDLHVWELDSGEAVLSTIVRVQVPDLLAAGQLSDRIRGTLRDQFGIEHATIESRHDAADHYVHPQAF